MAEKVGLEVGTGNEVRGWSKAARRGDAGESLLSTVEARGQICDAGAGAGMRAEITLGKLAQEGSY